MRFQQQDAVHKEGKLRCAKAEKKPVKWKKLASRELQAPEGMKLKTLLRRVLQGVGQAGSREARADFLSKLKRSSQFQIHDGHVKLSSK